MDDIVRCSFEGCGFTCPSANALQDLIAHSISNHAPAAPPLHNPVPAPAQNQRQPRIDRPSIDIGCDPHVWETFVWKWERFRHGSGITDATANTQLLHCFTDRLLATAKRSLHNLERLSVEDALTQVKKIAVLPVALGVRQTHALETKQDENERFRMFVGRIRERVVDCSFETACTHAPPGRTNCTLDANCAGHDYTDAIIKLVALNGIRDPDIKREVLGVSDLRTRDINDLISLVENKEVARDQSKPNALAMAGVSAFKKKGKVQSTPPTASPAVITPQRQGGDSNKAVKVVTPREKNCYCGNRFFDYVVRKNGSCNQRPYEECKACFERGKNAKKAGKCAAAEIGSESDGDDVPIGARLSAARLVNAGPVVDHALKASVAASESGPGSHPRLDVKFSVASKEGPHEISVRGAVADSGAQVCILPVKYVNKLPPIPNCRNAHLAQLKGADNGELDVSGVVEATLSATTNTGEKISTPATLYIVDNVDECYISCAAMKGLRIIDEHFPSPGARKDHECRLCASTATSDCKCTPRSMPPSRPTVLPYTPSPENIEQMKAWLLRRFAASTFNKCPHQELPTMRGPPLEIHLREDATPKKISTPAAIPLHWQNQVKRDLDNDVNMGVIEPVCEPSEWCQRMVCVRKPDGTPRRTVDLQPLNKHCKREEWVTNTPAKQARSVPKNAWKTVTDAWNGYHSVPLREADRHLTTFITPWGRYRYCRNPQGFVGAGDGYNRRFDAVLTDFVDKERCVDDTIYWDANLEKHWWRTIDFLTICGEAGIVLNPEKFQFCSKDVEFAGFRLTESRVAPLEKYMSAIRDFPTPANITDIRSWFGLVNQVSSYGQLRKFMAPFRPFLSPKTKFKWDASLDLAFSRCKKEILRAIESGVEMFDPNLPTCLRTDWSKEGMGYYLMQKTCACLTVHPACCADGWRMTLAGSRFNSATESRYAPIEGEALGVAWALEQTKFFTQGCDSLTVATDHKPLVKLLGDKGLDTISNPRLFRLKQRVGLWKFDIIHCAGRTNYFADATSRKPSEPADALEKVEGSLVAAAVASIAITPGDIEQADRGDPAYQAMRDAITAGAAPDVAACGPYWQYRDRMYVSNGKLLYDDRMIIPLPLRPRVLDVLHAAHQGVSSMMHRAAQCVFWPGISSDVQKRRASCATCNTIAPSNPQVPTEQSDPPTTPFESIAADYFDLGGHHYLVTVDRLSGWIDVTRAAPGTAASGAKGLISCLRSIFADKGVPVELSSDGGTEFTSAETAAFLKKWGVRHRISSAYFAQSNGRAEAAVKSAKRFLRDNTGPQGSLDMDAYLMALMAHRNTPDPIAKLSPAEILYGRPLRDALQFMSRLDKFSDPGIRPTWRESWDLKEKANRLRFFCQRQSTNSSARQQKPLECGQRVFVQSRHPTQPPRWDRSGTVMESKPHGAYIVKMDGSGRVSQRTRAHLKPVFLPFLPADTSPPPSPPPSCHGQEIEESQEARGRDLERRAQPPECRPEGPLPDMRTPPPSPQPSRGSLQPPPEPEEEHKPESQEPAERPPEPIKEPPTLTPPAEVPRPLPRRPSTRTPTGRGEETSDAAAPAPSFGGAEPRRSGRMRQAPRKFSPSR